MKNIFFFVFALLSISCGFTNPQNNKNISMPLPPAFATAATNNKLRVDLIAVGEAGKKTTTLKITNGVVGGTINLAPGTWTLTLQFYWLLDSGDYLPVAFVEFGKKTVGESGLDLTYTADDIKFDLDTNEEISLSINTSSDCVETYDCDGDNYSNFTELSQDSDPEDADDIPDLFCGNGTIEAPEECDDKNSVDSDGCNNVCLKAPTITANLNTGDSVQDTEILSIDAASANSEIKRLIITSPTLTDTNSLPDTFDANWDTNNLTEDTNTTLKFLAEDQNGHKATLNLTVTVDNAPNITNFGDTNLIQQGNSADLTWDVDNYTSLQIDNGIGEVTTSPTIVSPTVTTTYTLTATRVGATKTFTSNKAFTLSVNDSPVFGTHTTAVGQDPASGTTLSWTESDANTSDTLTSTITVYEGTTCTGDTVATQTSTTTSTSISGLEPRTDYYYTVGINDGKGGTAAGACQKFTTSDTGLAAWWRFDEGTGTTATDSSGNGNTGTLNSGLDASGWTTGVANGALQFDGTDDFVQVADNSKLQPGTGDFTAEGWIKFLSISSESLAPLFYKGPGIPFNCDSNHWRFGILENLGTQPLEYVACNYNTSDITISLSTPSIVAGIWAHIAMVYEQGNPNRVSMYINGQLVNTTYPMHQDLTDISPPYPLYMGSSANLYFLNGFIDEATLYNRALSTQEIRDYCQRNDPTGATCAADDVPAPRSPESITLPPTRAFLSWEVPTLAEGKTFDHYNVCYSNTTDLNLFDCIAPSQITNSNQTYFVVDTLVSNSTYQWKIQTCYTNSTCSTYSPVWSVTTDDSVVGWWKFDDGTANDSSGHGNNGALINSATLLDGALQINTSDDYVDLNPSGDMNVDDIAFNSSDAGYAVEALFKLSAPTTNGNFFQLYHYPGISPGSTLYYQSAMGVNLLDVNAGGENDCQLPDYIYTPEGICYNASNGNYKDYADTTDHSIITDNQFHQAIMSYSYDSLISTVTLLVDGSTSGSSSDQFYGFSKADFDKARIGQFSSGFPIFIDEVAIYNKSLSEAEATNSYCAVEALAGTNPLPAVCR